MYIKNIMSSKIVTIHGDATILEACKKYRDHKVGSIFITINDELAGIVTERDLIERSMCNMLDIKTAKVKEIMSHDLITIDLLDKVENAIEKMKANKIKKLAVVDGDELVGIVTLTDIAYSRPSIKNYIQPG